MSSRWIDRVRHTLGFRLALWYALIFVAGALSLLGVTYALVSSSLRERDHELIRSTLAHYAREYEEGGLAGLDRAITRDRVAGRHESLFVRVLGPDASALFVNLPAGWRDFDLTQLGAPLAPGAPGWVRLPGRARAPELEVASLLLPDGTLFQVGKSAESRAELLERFRAIAFVVLGSLLGIALLGGALLTRAALRPVRDLIGAVRGIVRTGRIASRVPVRGRGDPLDELSLLFNEMLDRIETLIAGLRGSLDNVAHDLRTPLTRLRGIAEEALRSGDPAACREALADCLEEVERVAQTLDTLMDVSEAETGTMALRRDAFLLGRSQPAAAGAGQPCRQRGQVHPQGRPRRDRGTRDGDGRGHRGARRRRGHSRPRPAAGLGPPLSRRPQPVRARPGPRSQPGAGGGAGPRGRGRGRLRAGPGRHVHDRATGRARPVAVSRRPGAGRRARRALTMDRAREGRET